MSASAEEIRDEQLRRLARETYGTENVDIDPGAPVTLSESGGAYVQAWVWVPFADECYDESGEPYPFGRCDSCGAPCGAGGCTVDASHVVALDVE